MLFVHLDIIRDNKKENVSAVHIVPLYVFNYFTAR